MLCEHASVREALLHVLGAGITLVDRSSFPATLGLSAALLLESESGDQGKSFEGELRLLEEGSSDLLHRVSFTLEWRGDVQENPLPSTVPLVLGLDGAHLPKAGRYRIEFRFGDDEPLVLRFVAREALKIDTDGEEDSS